MIERDLIEIREPADGKWNNAPAMTKPEIEAALADPDTWIWSEDRINRMVMLMTTDDPSGNQHGWSSVGHAVRQ